MKTDLFQSCGQCWLVSQICWHIECSSFTASSFTIWNSSTGTPSHPLALFVVMLSKAHLTSHSRMSGSRWVITPSWLSGSWRSFLYSSGSSCHLFLVSSACQVPATSVLYRAHFHGCVTKQSTRPARLAVSLPHHCFNFFLLLSTPSLPHYHPSENCPALEIHAALTTV